MIATWRALYSQAMHHSIFCQKVTIKYRKTPEISLGAYIFQRPFLRGLFLEGLIFGGAYLWGEICISKSIGLALYLEVNLPFFLCFTLYLRAIFQVQAARGLWRGNLTEGFLRYQFGGLINLEGLIHGQGSYNFCNHFSRTKDHLLGIQFHRLHKNAHFQSILKRLSGLKCLLHQLLYMYQFTGLKLMVNYCIKHRALYVNL